MSRILLAGATGLVGNQVMQRLAGKREHELHIIARRPVNALPKNVRQQVLDTADWSRSVAEIAPDIAISCLGTTIKTAGSKEAFSTVDLDLVTVVAHAAQAAGARHMIAISSVGANATSANFYLSTKGKAENALRAMGFKRLDILRPGLLRGSRKESRTGEALGIMVSPLIDVLLHGTLRRYRSINSATVAAAIANFALQGGDGAFIHENDAIAALAG